MKILLSLLMLLSLSTQGFYCSGKVPSTGLDDFFKKKKQTLQQSITKIGDSIIGRGTETHGHILCPEMKLNDFSALDHMKGIEPKKKILIQLDQTIDGENVIRVNTYIATLLADNKINSYERNTMNNFCIELKDIGNNQVLPLLNLMVGKEGQISLEDHCHLKTIQ